MAASLKKMKIDMASLLCREWSSLD